MWKNYAGNTTVAQKIDTFKWKEHRFGLSPERWNSLRAKSFWITGAGTGYGRCMTVALAAGGATVFLTGRRREKLLETIEEMRSLSITADNCHVLPADITDSNDRERACKEVKKSCQSLYGLINNAALPPRSIAYPLQDSEPEYWEKLMRTNVTAPLLLTRAIFPHMLTGGALRVLFITSEAGWAFTPGFGDYNVSKAALNSLSSSMAEEFASRYPATDIQINALVPGEAKTEMNQSSSESPYSVASMALILLSQPAGGPNGRFFHRDGRHLQFAYAQPYEKKLF